MGKGKGWLQILINFLLKFEIEFHKKDFLHSSCLLNYIYCIKEAKRFQTCLCLGKESGAFCLAILFWAVEKATSISCSKKKSNYRICFL